MTVAELKIKLENMPDGMKVLIPLNAGTGFDGCFFSPCVEESGEGELGTEDLTEEEITKRENLKIPIETKKEFLLVPCGFFSDHDKHEYVNN